MIQNKNNITLHVELTLFLLVCICIYILLFLYVNIHICSSSGHTYAYALFFWVCLWVCFHSKPMQFCLSYHQLNLWLAHFRRKLALLLLITSWPVVLYYRWYKQTCIYTACRPFSRNDLLTKVRETKELCLIE